MQRLVAQTLVALFSLPGIIACSSSDDSNSQTSEKALPLGCKHTQFEGDDRCIAVPAPSEGLQLHVGPTDYDNPDEVAPFMIGVGEERVDCYTLQTPNTETVYYFHQQNRMRPGSHHMIIRIVSNDTPLGWKDGGAFGCDVFGSIGGIPGSQTQVRDIPGVQLAPEDANLGRTLPPNAKVQFELHFLNNLPQDKKPRLREAWVNLFYKDPSTIDGTVRTISLIGGLEMNIPPHMPQNLHYTFPVTDDARVFDLFGHFHAHTTKFSAWLNHDGQRDLVYQSYNWSEPADLVFDRVNQNPQANDTTKVDGGWSGQLTVKPGDSIEWECDVVNTLDTPLKFANQAHTAEMCILFGGYISPNGTAPKHFTTFL